MFFWARVLGIDSATALRPDGTKLKNTKYNKTQIILSSRTNDTSLPRRTVSSCSSFLFYLFLLTYFVSLSVYGSTKVASALGG